MVEQRPHNEGKRNSSEGTPDEKALLDHRFKEIPPLDQNQLQQAFSNAIEAAAEGDPTKKQELIKKLEQIAQEKGSQ